MKIKLTISELELEVNVSNILYFKGTTTSAGDNPDDLDYEVEGISIGGIPVEPLLGQYLYETCIDPVDLNDAVLELAQQLDEAAKDEAADWKRESREMEACG